MLKNKYLSYIFITLFLILTISVNFILFFQPLSHFKPSDTYQEDDFEFRNLKISGSEINITTPENITYTGPMSGYYPASFSFDNDKNGINPEGWITTENPPLYEIEVVDQKMGHNKVVRFYDNENAWRSLNYFPESDPTTGTIELWVLGADVSNPYLGIGSRDTSDRRGFLFIIENVKRGGISGRIKVSSRKYGY